jgi:dihydroneopterin aldolase
MTIFLKDLVFQVCHGLYPEEAQVAGRFVVNIEITYNIGNQIVREINETIDYVSVYRLVERKMHEPEALLETLVMEIAFLILDSYAIAEHVFVKIEKCNPPIEGMEGSVAVAFNTVRT